MKALLQHTPRPSGYVTQAMIDQHGSFRAALAHLNAASRHIPHTPAVDAGRGQGRGR